jgi:hypothetical protein
MVLMALLEVLVQQVNLVNLELFVDLVLELVLKVTKVLKVNPVTPVKMEIKVLLVPQDYLE